MLGGETLLGTQIRSLGELSAVVERGVPKQTLRSVVAHVFGDAERQRGLIHSVVPQATFKRRRERLTPAESEKTERLARVTAHAEQVWGAGDDARAFLTTPHPLLDGRTPIEVAATDLGARRVEAILAGIEHGLPV